MKMKNMIEVETERKLQRRVNVDIGEGEANWLLAYGRGLRGFDLDNTSLNYMIRMLIMDNINRARKDNIITEEQAKIELRSLGLSESFVIEKVRISEIDLKNEN